MAKSNSNEYSAKGGMTVLSFVLIIIGQIWLLRNQLFSSFTALPLPYYIEMIWWIPLIAGIVICWIRPKGWGGHLGCTIALVLFVVYAVFSILTYKTFSAGYLTGFSPEFSSAGGALVGFKLVLALIGVTAGIPAEPKIDNWEYSRRLREKVEEQNAQWAMASVKGAHADLENTLDRLKATLSEEEMQALIADLQKSLDDPSSVKKTEPSEPSEQPDGFDQVVENWKGWGQGM